jgi:hypothetical protein
MLLKNGEGSWDCEQKRETKTPNAKIELGNKNIESRLPK